MSLYHPIFIDAYQGWCADHEAMAEALAEKKDVDSIILSWEYNVEANSYTDGDLRKIRYCCTMLLV